MNNTIYSIKIIQRISVYIHVKGLFHGWLTEIRTKHKKHLNISKQKIAVTGYFISFCAFYFGLLFIFVNIVTLSKVLHNLTLHGAA